VTSRGLALPGNPLGGFIRVESSCKTGLPPSVVAPILGAPMEKLIELVAASFVRHGIESPAGDLAQTKPAPAIRPADPILATALPEHNFRKSLQGDPAP
jgi:hypothetical protein